MTMNAQRKFAVAGGTGRVGRHAVAALEAAGHEVVTIARSTGVDVITGEGLAQALAGVEVIVDTSTQPTPDEKAATDFFKTSTHNLMTTGAAAGVQRMVVVSIVGADRFGGGYGAAVVEHERLAMAGPIPATVLRATQFHEFVPELMDWGRRGDVIQIPEMRTQLIAAQAAGAELADMALDPSIEPGTIRQVAGPRVEKLVDAARLVAERRGESTPIEEVFDPGDPAAEAYRSGALLPDPGTKTAGPTFAEWLESADRVAA
jgi:uncharacterized protein YbjT (DUF2867 family)